jgi:hypothetical protein
MVDNQDSYAPVLNALEMKQVFAVDKIEAFPYQRWSHLLFLDAAVDFSSPDNGIKAKLDTYADLVNEYAFYEIFKLYEYRQKAESRLDSVNSQTLSTYAP